MIANLALSREENTIILFNKITHGQELAKIINEKTERPVYFVYGDVDLKTRDEIKKALESENNAIAVVSYGTFSTGISIKNIHHAILAVGYKSKVRVLQTIGRGLRLHPDKQVFNMYDLVDDLNYSMKHFLVRFKYYTKKHFKYTIKNISV